MTSPYDVVVVGAGHNGLTAAGYLAKAGLTVLVLERSDHAGGGVHSAELAEPGFVSERHATLHAMILANPLIADDELGLLSEYGLDYIQLDKPYVGVFDDGTSVPIFRDVQRTAEAIARISERDAEAYPRFAAVAEQIVDVVVPGFFVPPVDPATLGPMLAQLPVGPQLAASMSSSVLEVLQEWFTDDRVIITLARWASEIITSHPGRPETGLFAYAAAGLVSRYGMALPRGGGSTLVDALLRMIEAHGGEVRLGTTVDSIVVEDGRAVGVRLAGGDEVRANRAVVASIHPHLLAAMVPGVPAPVAQAAADTVLSRYTGLVVHASLNEPLRYRAGRELDGFPANTLSPRGIDRMIETFDVVERGAIPDVPLVGAGCTSVPDPSRAPEGMAVLHLFCMTCYDLADGGAQRWESFAEEYGRAVLAQAGEFFENLDDANIRTLEVVSPLDHEKDSPSFQHGDIGGIGMFTSQLVAARPTSALSDYTVPGVESLYLIGPFQHPGAGVVGGGRPVAIKLLGDLGHVGESPFQRYLVRT